MELKEQARWEVWIDCGEHGLMELTRSPVTDAEAREICAFTENVPHDQNVYVFSTGYMTGRIEDVYSSITINDDAVIFTREDAPRPHRVTTYLDGEIDAIACFRTYGDALRNYENTIEDIVSLKSGCLQYVSIKECSA